MRVLPKGICAAPPGGGTFRMEVRGAGFAGHGTAAQAGAALLHNTHSYPARINNDEPTAQTSTPKVTTAQITPRSL